MGAQERCEGHRHEHHLGTEEFSTSSRVFKQDRWFVYETCVENRGERDLWVNWKVPGPISYVPPNRAVSSQRIFLTESTVNAVACLEYGSLAKVMRETYLGHEDDKGKLEREENEGCRSALASTTAEAYSPADATVSSTVRLFVPSDSEQPDTTMLEFVAEVGAVYTKGMPTQQTISYSVAPLKGRKNGDPNAMTIRLASRQPMLNWASVSDASLIEKGAQLGLSKEFSLMLDAEAAPALKNVRYEILDKNQNLVGAFEAPVWAEANP